jgi:hypothetical protein
MIGPSKFGDFAGPSYGRLFRFPPRPRQRPFPKSDRLLAAWLGHGDNGRTAMLIYGHLRKGHSDAEAARMQFLPPAPQEPPQPSVAPGAEAAPLADN